MNLTCSVNSRFSTSLRKTDSAIGDRHMLPSRNIQTTLSC